MKIKFTEAALERLVPPCFAGRIREAMAVMGPLIVSRRDGNGRSFAMVAGSRVSFRLHDSKEAGEEVTVIDVSEPEHIGAIIDRLTGGKHEG
jgi:hypothetical protein